MSLPLHRRPLHLSPRLAPATVSQDLTAARARAMMGAAVDEDRATQECDPSASHGPIPY